MFHFMSLHPPIEEPTLTYLYYYLQDEFCTYMLLEYQEKEVMAGEKLAPFPYPLHIMHKLVIFKWCTTGVANQ